MADQDAESKRDPGMSPEMLIETLYSELRELASRKLSRERTDHTLQPTALVHEAYMRLKDQSRVQWQGRTHFQAVAAQAMQRILIDHARSKNREKRGGGWRRVALDDAYAMGDRSDLDPGELVDALETMRKLDERQARIVELRLLGGLDMDAIADQVGVSVRTVERDWKMGRAWMRRAMSGDTSE